MTADGMLGLDQLRQETEAGRIDTVLAAFGDMQGRLQGKRLHAQHFLDEVVERNAEGCNYLLAVDVEMNTVEGYEMSSWDTGYGDFVFVPDLATLRMAPWLEGTALVMCDLEWHDGTPVEAAPRRVLRRQLDRLADRGLRAYVGTELEFMVFRDTYEEAWDKAYRDLVPANRYNVDYSMLGTARIEPLLRRVRNAMAGAGLRVESAKGECNLGQHEINFRYDEALATADGHSIYKNAAKEIAADLGYALTFMAKFDEAEGSSCHTHLSLRDDAGTAVFSDGDHGMSEQFRQFLAGQLAHLRELTLFLAPNINSYKRFAAGSFAPTVVSWGPDNRTCALRVVGHDPPSTRMEHRVPGADVNPYLAIAAMIAAGLAGVDGQYELEPPVTGNAYALADRPTVPATLRDARDLFADSKLVAEAFGEEVRDHYLNNARVEIAAFDAAVTDWERFRGFERL